MTLIAVHEWITHSRANGPGSRTVVWTQGCTLACPGCFNPHTHAPSPTGIPVPDLLADLLQADPAPDGLTITGGEPLQQPAATEALARAWQQATSTGVIILTGYTWNEIASDPDRHAAALSADLVIAGRYNHAQRTAHGLRGSRNKEYHALTSRYDVHDVQHTPEREIHVSPDGTITITGIDPDSRTEAATAGP